MKTKCCHPSALILCPHSCPPCRREACLALAKTLQMFQDDCEHNEYTDTGDALELMDRAEKLLLQIARGG